MSLLSDLPAKLDDTRLVYETTDVGVRIQGNPVILEFESPQHPRSVAETISTVDDPWKIFGIPSQLAEEYWKLVGTFLHVENGACVDASPFTVEIAPEWIRFYVKEDCCEQRATEFIEALDDTYGVSVTLA